MAEEREALQQLRLVLEREKLQVDATRAQQEACNDRLVSEGTQMQTGLNQEWWKAAVQQLQHEILSGFSSGLERKEQELRHAEARNVATEQDFSRRLQEAQDAAKLSAEKAVAQEREALQQLRLVLEREKLQVDATRAQQEACNDRLVSEGTQMQTGLNQEWWKAAVQQLQHEILSGFSSDSSTPEKKAIHSRKRPVGAMDFRVGQLQQEKIHLSSELERLRSKLNRFEVADAAAKKATAATDADDFDGITENSEAGFNQGDWVEDSPVQPHGDILFDSANVRTVGASSSSCTTSSAYPSKSHVNAQQLETAPKQRDVPELTAPSPANTPRECLADRFQAEIEAPIQAKRAGTPNPTPAFPVIQEPSERSEQEEEGVLEFLDDEGDHESFDGSDMSGW